MKGGALFLTFLIKRNQSLLLFLLELTAALRGPGCCGKVGRRMVFFFGLFPGSPVAAAFFKAN